MIAERDILADGRRGIGFETRSPGGAWGAECSQWLRRR